MAQMTSPTLRQYGAAVRTFLALTVVVGLVYPVVMTGVAQVLFAGRANGSLLHRGGKTVGSSLIGQDFSRDPAYFQSRPSAAGTGYDPLSTSASNLGPENKNLIAAVRQRRSGVARRDGVPPSTVPPDALLASGSGLDPHISPAYALEQVRRVARVRGLSVAVVRRLVDEHTQHRVLGFLGEPRVNVLELNLALDRISR